jgi:GT2 family glycosyltransferase
MAAGTIDLSIVLVNWNACELTTSAIRSIEEHTRGVSFEVIVIDNHSTHDRSVDELPRRFPSIVFVANPHNLGFSAASNQGLARSHGRYMLLLNTDTIQVEDVCTAAVRYLDGQPDVGALGILHRNADAARSPQQSTFSFPRPWHEVALLAGFRHGIERPLDLAERDVDWVCASFLIIRRECLNEVGPFDERFFVYDEDIDWCRRAWRGGWRVRFWPRVSMLHMGSGAQPFIRDKTFMHFRSHLSYIRKHHFWLASAAYYLVMVGRLSLATLWQLLRWAVGRAQLAEVRERSTRQWQFARLRPSRPEI